MRKIKRNYTPEELYNDYIVSNLTRKQISEKYSQPIHLIDKDLMLNGWKKPKTLLSEVNGGKIRINKNELYNYYIVENHTTNETAAHFSVHERTIRRRLREYDIYKNIELQNLASRRKQIEKYGNIFTQSQYYQENVVKIMLQHNRETCLKKYGVEYICQVDGIKSRMSAKYIYEDELFDSSWELALWIYAKDHNEDIVHNPLKIPYKIKNVTHYYFPDFKYHNEIIEIKGDHLVDENKQLKNVYKSQQIKDEGKNRCIIENNIVIWTSKDVKPYLEYIDKVYGKDYLKSFKKI